MRIARVALVAVAIPALIASGALPANAEPMYAAYANACTPILDQPGTDYATAGGTVGSVCFDALKTAAARANSFGLGVGASTSTAGEDFTNSSADAWASVVTEFMITGPTGSVDTSLNVQLTGGFAGGIPGDGGTSTRTYMWEVTTPYINWTGTCTEKASGAGYEYFNCPPTYALQAGDPALSLTSATFSVPVNTLIPLTMYLSAGVNAAKGTGQVLLIDTFYFPTTGPVFNLPDGYSATIYGLNVENNRVVRPAAVPEPATLALISLGLAGFGFSRRKQ